VRVWKFPWKGKNLSIRIGAIGAIGGFKERQRALIAIAAQNKH